MDKCALPGHYSFLQPNLMEAVCVICGTAGGGEEVTCLGCDFFV